MRIIDVRSTPSALESAHAQITGGTDVLGVCTDEDHVPFCRDPMTEVRLHLPDGAIICDGSIVTFLPHVFIRTAACDVAIISEGEIAILELLEGYSGQDPAYLAWRSRPRSLGGLTNNRGRRGHQAETIP